MNILEALKYGVPIKRPKWAVGTNFHDGEQGWTNIDDLQADDWELAQPKPPKAAESKENYAVLLAQIRDLLKEVKEKLIDE